MRPIADVRQAILNVIEHVNIRLEFQDASDSIVTSIMYAAPETHGYWWGRLCGAMRDAFEGWDTVDAKNTEWGKKAIAILRGELNYQDYLEKPAELPA